METISVTREPSIITLMTDSGIVSNLTSGKTDHLEEETTQLSRCILNMCVNFW